MTDIPSKTEELDELESIRKDIISLQAQISLVERKYKRIFTLLENMLAEIKTNWSVTSWIFNETILNTGKHIPDEIKKLVDGG